MTLVVLNRVALPAFAVAALLVVFVIPAIRMRRRTGVWPVVAHRAAHTLQRWTAGWLLALASALLAWVALYAWRGPAPLGVWETSAALTAVGWLLALAGLGLMVLGRRHLGASWRVGIDDRPTELVTAGVYGVIRNPIFAGAIVMIGGLALVMPCPWTLMDLAACLALLGVQARAEEEHLQRRHGERYRVYASSVGRFVPMVGRLRGGGYPERDDGRGRQDR